MPESPRWLIDTDKEMEGLRVIADLHGGDLNDPIALAEFREIKDKVFEDVGCSRLVKEFCIDEDVFVTQRESGEARSYMMMWRKYKRRVLLAMSSQAFAQLVRHVSFTG